jgi:hyperosmotically inducible protein
MKKILALMLVGAAGVCTAAANDSATSRTAIDKAATDYKAAKAQCGSMRGNAKTICVDEAKAAKARAEADAMAQDTSTTPRARAKAMTSVADAEYALSRARCADKAGTDKNSCMADAKSSHVTALADAKASRDNTQSGTSGTVADRAGTAADRAGTAVGNAADHTGETMSNATGRAGDAMADTTITTKVKADFVKEKNLSSTGIHVETVKGVVMLSGFVNSKGEADRAVELARSVDGVKKVESAIKVK